ncbi:amidohydrolase family protein [Ornithinimicrobium humiphilum]|uniref:Imidazolonepropionase-like amidohydrolase n=1 Tax=Ornithinimicrobium humiphilum TaxID=125288 RepID=A0A543KMK7_9MICO|nr:amidohydrolase family protein [Ornithinimicrobium humiphilum]TQM96312.1 imidazolonepropionase-like amidohydrolase [Ornithinimicrobium humiphilum]
MNTPDVPLLLSGVTVVDPVAGDVEDAAVLTGTDGRVAALGSRDEVLASSGEDVREVRTQGYVVPGLINMHVHLGLALPGAMSDAVDGASDSQTVLLMADAAARTLQAGVTTVRLVGESRYLDVDLRAAVDRGAVPGPRIFTACHALCCTGGHGWDADALEADGADAFARATRLQLRAGADLIKVCVSGGIAGEHESIDTPQLTEDEVRVVIETAHAWGKQVTAHAASSATVLPALRLGLDGVEHGYSLDEETVALMAEKGTWYVPTITVSRCREFFELNQVPEWMMERALGAGPEHWASLQRAIAAGVRIVMGSDMPPYAPFDGTTATVREMEFMEEAGMSPREVLAAATSRAAEWLGADDLGTLRPGSRADLLLLDEDPREGVSALRSLRAVVQGGRPVRDDRAELVAWTAVPA